jgi:hypothetical protein
MRILIFILLSFLFCNAAFAQYADSTIPKPKPIGSVLRTVRKIDMTNDSIPEVLQIETTKGKRIKDIKVKLEIFSGKKKLYEHIWKASDFFDPIDTISEAVKWFRLQRILRVFFSNQNFSSSDSESITSLLSRVRAVDIQPDSEEAKEYSSLPHKVFSIYAGRDMLYGITWLDSKKKFVTLWRN